MESPIVISKADGIIGVLDAMRANAGSPEVQVQACQVLGELIGGGDPEQHTAFFAAGGLDVVLSAMRTHDAVPAVGERGCYVLSCLPMSMMHAKFEGCMFSSDGLHAVLVAMRIHAAIPAVAEMGCRALINLLNRLDDLTIFVAAGGIHTLIAAMRTHSAEVAVVERGCYVLTYLMDQQCSDHDTAIIAAGGVDALVVAMSDHIAVPEVGLEGCRGFRSFADRNPHHQALILAAGGLDNVLALMRMHPRNDDIQEWGILFLESLVSVVEDQTTVQSSGGREVLRANIESILLLADSVVEVVLAALRTHGTQTEFAYIYARSSLEAVPGAVCWGWWDRRRVGCCENPCKEALCDRAWVLGLGQVGRKSLRQPDGHWRSWWCGGSP
jgi:hypothetical protein